MSINLSSQKNSVCVAMNENSGSEAGAHAQTFFICYKVWGGILIHYEAAPEMKFNHPSASTVFLATT